jgi:sulfur carrier protein
VKVALNGSEHELHDGATVVDVVAAATGDADRPGIAVALDGEVVPRGRWGETRLAEGQRVEVLEARQGG